MTLTWGRLGMLSVAVLLSGCTAATTGPAPASQASSASTATAGLPSEITRPSLGFPSSGSSTTPPPAAPSTSPTAGPTDVRKGGDSAAFSSPSGRIVCFMGVEGTRCEFNGDKAWKPPQPPGCQLDWDSILVVEETAGAGCAGDTVAETAQVGSEYTTWRRPSDPTVVVYGMTMAVLPYGSGLISGAYTCESATTGVTCRNTTTGHGFTMAREAYSLF